VLFAFVFTDRNNISVSLIKRELDIHWLLRRIWLKYLQ
jgi:hypothetical protein